MSIPAHLFRRQGVFYFRWAIPANVRGLLRPAPRWEVRISLRCHDRRIAIPAAFQLWQRALALADTVMAAEKHVQYTDFMSLLKPDVGGIAFGATSNGHDQPEPLADILGTYDIPTLQRAVAALQNRGASVFVSISSCDVTLYNRREVGINEFHEEIDSVEQGYAETNAKLLSSTLTDIVAALGNSFSVQRFLAPRISLLKDLADHFQPAEATRPVTCNVTSVRAYAKDVRAIQHLLASSTLPAQQDRSTDLVQRITLGEAMQKWIEAHTGYGKDSIWNPNTAKENPAYIRLFIELVGDKIVGDVTSKDAQDYRDAISFLPPNFRKKPEFAGKEVQEIVVYNRQHDGKRPTARTLEKKLQTVNSFFKYCVEQSYIAKNPFANLGKQIAKVIKNKQKREAPRVSFTDDELKLLFEGDTALKIFEKQKRASPLWVPVLSLYTGARLAELCELRASQVQTKDGISFLEFNEWDETANRLKNGSAIRQIPLHPALIELGFLAYANSRKDPADSTTPLFPEQRGLDHKQGNKIVSYFFNNTLLKGIGIKTKNKVFHSFRHTVVDKFKRSPAKEGLISAFIGHEDEDAPTWDTDYGTALQARYTEELLQYLTYPIDWSKFHSMLQRKKLVG